MGGMNDDIERLKAEQQAQIEAAIAAKEAAYEKKYKSPELQYNPVQESWVDKDGKSVPKGTPGATQKVNLRSEFQMSGPEDYIKALQDQNAVNRSGALNDAQMGAAQAAAQARTQSAMRGGLRTGTGDAINRSNMWQLMQQRQGVNRTGNENVMNIAQKGEELKRGTEAYNLENLMKGAESVNRFNLDSYKSKMAGLAGRDAADATRDAAANSGKK